MLEKLSYTADVVSDGMLAVEATRETRYDIILMDRAQIIALTANAMDSDRHRCLEAGMDDYISKPFVLETLREKLRLAFESVNGTARM